MLMRTKELVTFAIHLRDTPVSQHWGLVGQTHGDCSTYNDGIAAALECDVRGGWGVHGGRGCEHS